MRFVGCFGIVIGSQELHHFHSMFNALIVVLAGQTIISELVDGRKESADNTNT